MMTRAWGGSVYINGALWFSHTVFLPGDVAYYDAVDWWQVNPVTHAVLQYGRVADPTGTIFYFYPSINVNGAGDALLGYCESSLDMYPSSSYSFHAHTDAANTMESNYLFKLGVAPYDREGTGVERWGDFTGATVDPTDSSFWDFNQWSNVNDAWGTIVANFKVSTNSCPIPSALTSTNVTDSSATFSWSPVSGDSVYYIEYKTLTGNKWILDSTSATTFTIKGLNGATEYLWEVKSVCNLKVNSPYAGRLISLH